MRGARPACGTLRGVTFRVKLFELPFPRGDARYRQKDAPRPAEVPGFDIEADDADSAGDAAARRIEADFRRAIRSGPSFTDGRTIVFYVFPRGA